MLIVKILLAYILGICLAEFNTIYIPVALVCVAGIVCAYVKRSRPNIGLVFVVALANLISLGDKSASNDINYSQNEEKTVLSDLAHHIDALSLSRQTKSLCFGVLLGDKSQFDYSEKKTIREAGMSHIVAVSGFHIGILYLVFFYVLLPLRLLGCVNMHKTLVLSIVWLYVYLIGSPISAIRASLLITLVQLSWMLHRQSLNSHLLYSTALIILLFDTQQLWNVGFQLSFFATLGIMLIQPLIKNKDKVSRLLIITLSAQVATLPIISYYFHIVPFFGWIQGLLIVPLLPLFVILLLICLVFPSFHLLVNIVDLMGQGFFLLAEKISSLELLCLGGRVGFYPSALEAVLFEFLSIFLILYVSSKPLHLINDKV